MCLKVYSLVLSMKNDPKIQQNEFGQMVGWPVEQYLVPHITTQILQGQRLSLIPFSLASLSQMKQDQLWHNNRLNPMGVVGRIFLIRVLTALKIYRRN